VIGFPTVISAVLPDNAASRRVADKLGMTVDGSIKRLGQSHLRYAIANPHPDTAPGSGFSLECTPYDEDEP